MGTVSCKNCGGALQFGNQNIVKCRFCGSLQTLPKTVEDNKLVEAYGLIRQREFSEAQVICSDILRIKPDYYEAYWARALARNGVVYVNEIGGTKVPTCQNIVEMSFLKDSDVIKAIELAPDDISENYKSQSEKIENIRKEWYEKASKEPPYDVFICFKDSDKENGVSRTRDSEYAEDLFNYLSAKKGLNVFFSRVSLMGKVSDHYEPYIYNALKTAKVMIVYCERAEYFSSVWLKNEWSRFITRMQKENMPASSLIVAHKKVDPYQIPSELLGGRQAIDLSKPSAFGVLVESVVNAVAAAEQNSKAKPGSAFAFGVDDKKNKAKEEKEAKQKAKQKAKEEKIKADQQKKKAQAERKAAKKEKKEEKKLKLDESAFSDLDAAAKKTSSKKKKAMITGFSILMIALAVAAVLATVIYLFPSPDPVIPPKGSTTAPVTTDQPADPSTVVSGKFGQTNSLTWKFDTLSGHLTIEGAGAMENWTLKWEDYTPWKDYTESIKKIMLGNGVTNIGNNAFHGCTGLTSVTIPDSVTNIGYYAFQGCTGLTSVIVPDSVTKIGSYAFQGCTGLTSVTVPGNVTSIGSNAFADCTALTNVTFADGVKSIGSYSFQGCTSLKTVTVPASVTSVGNLAFSNCSGLERIVFNSKTTRLPTDAKSIPESTVISCYSGSLAYTWAIDNKRTIDLLDGEEQPQDTTTAVPDTGECLTETVGPIDLGNNLSWTYEYQGGVGRGKLTISGSGKMADFGDDVKANGNPDWTTYTITDLVIEEGVTYIGKYAFNHLKDLVSVSLPASLVEIAEENPFAVCPNLTNFSVDSANTVFTSKGDSLINKKTKTLVAGTMYSEIPTDGSVIKIGMESFRNCYYLPSITIPDAVIEIGDGAFTKCTMLTSFSIPNNVTRIGNWAFHGCTGLTSITVPDSVEYVGNSAFYECTGLEKIIFMSLSTDPLQIRDVAAVIPESTVIYCYAGSAAEAWAEKYDRNFVTIPDGGKFGEFTNSHTWTFSIITGELFIDGSGDMGNWYADNWAPWYDFRTDITSVKIGNSVTSIGDWAFDDCRFLTNVTIGNSVASIGDYAFQGCTSLTGVTIPDSVMSIGSHAFNGCTRLTNLTIPNSVTSISSAAFLNCSVLTSITYTGTKTEWAAISKTSSWNYYTGEYTVHCTDGDIAKSNS